MSAGCQMVASCLIPAPKRDIVQDRSVSCRATGGYCVIVSIQDRSSLEKASGSSKEKRRCSCRANARFVSLRLAEGRRPKGRGGAWRRSLIGSGNRILNEASSRPSSQRDVAPFQVAERRSASRQRFVVRAGRRIVGMVSFPHRSEVEMV